METVQYKVYPFRIVILIAYMLLIAVNQMLWISFAPITQTAVDFYDVSELQIGLLSMSFMIVFVFVSVPASWVIDSFGIRVGVGIGAVFTGVFGYTRGISHSYDLVLLSQIGIAIGQPFILNAMTKFASRWFRIEERATAAGLGTLSMYLGIFLGLILTPLMTQKYGINQMLFLYGCVSIAVAILFLILSKERPKTPPCDPSMEERSLVYDGLKNAFSNKNFYILLLVFFIGLGIFNSVTTWIEQILVPRGFNAEEAGWSGGMMIIGGIIGALILPVLSDRYQNRKLFIQIALIGASIGLIGVTFVINYSLLLMFSSVLGFFLLSAGPIGFQYGAEITYPTSEGTSNGLLILVGQISGILFVFGMDFFKSNENGSMDLPLQLMILLLVLCTLISFKLKESPFMKSLK